MIERRTRQLTYANVVSTIALVVALGTGSAWAASTVLDGRTLRNGSVGSSKIAANAITSAKVRNGSLLASDFRRGQLPAGPAGPAGKDGERGPTGTIDTSQFYDRAASDARFSRLDPNVTYVSGTGTPSANGAALLDAVASAPAPVDSDHPRVVVLGPGMFDIGTQSLQMRDRIHVAGSSKEATTIRGSGTTVVAAASAELRDVTVLHDIAGAGSYSAVVVNAGTHLRLTRSLVITSLNGGGDRTGAVMSGAGSFLTMQDSSITVRGGVNHTGIDNTNGTVTLTYGSISVTGPGVSTAISTQAGGGVVSYGSRIRAFSGSSTIAIGSGTGASVVQLGATEVLGSLAAAHTYFCGGSFNSTALVTLPPDCGV